MSKPNDTVIQIWFFIAGVGLFGAFGIWGWQLYEFARFGMWPQYSPIDLGYTLTKATWFYGPSDWAGIYKILDSINAGAALAVGSVVISSVISNLD